MARKSTTTPSKRSTSKAPAKPKGPTQARRLEKLEGQMAALGNLVRAMKPYPDSKVERAAKAFVATVEAE